MSTVDLLPLERWFQARSFNGDSFPNGKTNYFEVYKTIKSYLAREVYPLIGPATSAEDGGMFTDHGPNHFNAVIYYAGKLMNLPSETNGSEDIFITPYESFITLLSILLHDAGNIYGRHGHEGKALEMYKAFGPALCTDQFEAKIVASVAKAHGGKVKSHNGESSKDTIGQSSLRDLDTYSTQTIRPRLLAALVRFADEICEDRGRIAKYLFDADQLPKWSEAYHAYANGITSVTVDKQSKCVNLKIELEKKHVVKQFGKGTSSDVKHVYLMDEIFLRLEKMYDELMYCRRYMVQHVTLNCIRAKVTIYDEDMEPLKEEVFELKEEGYPSSVLNLYESYPGWTGEAMKSELDSM